MFKRTIAHIRAIRKLGVSKAVFALLLFYGSIILLALTCVAGWITHIVVCIHAKMWLLLIAGAICAPVGIIHGIGVWFSWWN